MKLYIVTVDRRGHSQCINLYSEHLRQLHNYVLEHVFTTYRSGSFHH